MCWILPLSGKLVLSLSVWILPLSGKLVLSLSVIFLSWVHGWLELLLLSHFSRVQLCDPIDGSPTDSSVPGILQARVLEWVAISFSKAWKWKVKSLSRVRLLATPWTAAHQAPPSMGFSRQEYRSGVPLPAATAQQRVSVLHMASPRQDPNPELQFLLNVYHSHHHEVKPY